MSQAGAVQPRRYTRAEYALLERDALDKHEYDNGRIVAMAGTSPEHALIAPTVSAAMVNGLQGKPCRVYSSDLRLWIEDKDKYVYPDVSVICGRVERDPDDPTRMAVTNPTVVVEVLSPSTEAYDRGEKMLAYLTIPTLKEYVLVNQAAPRIESLRRQSDDTWVYTYAAGLESSFVVQSVQVTLPLGEIYRGIDFPT
ncbi:MAG: Uma2 family endonuclease [Tepidisphaeraceae bacterium]